MNNMIEVCNQNFLVLLPMNVIINMVLVIFVVVAGDMPHSVKDKAALIKADLSSFWHYLDWIVLVTLDFVS